MAAIPEGSWVGMVDYSGREILYVKKLKTPSFYEDNIAIILDKTGQLEIMRLQRVEEIIAMRRPSVVFQGKAQNISLRGGGRIYFTEQSSRQASYKMDYDSDGNLWVRTMQWRNQIDGPFLFMSKLWVTIIKRRRRKRREDVNRQRQRQKKIRR